MVTTRWREVELAEVAVPDAGWHYADPVATAKLATSLRRHGQLRPLVVRTDADGALVLVDGRWLFAAMRAAGLETAWAVDVGPLDVYEAQRLALALEVRLEVDYAAVAMAVAGLLEQGRTAEDLASASPFTPERLRYFETLAGFDWTRFAEAAGGQAGIDWSEAAPEPAPAASEPPPAVAQPLPKPAGAAADREQLGLF